MAERVVFEHDGKKIKGLSMGERHRTSGVDIYIIIPANGKAPRTKQGPYQHRVSGIAGFVALIPADRVEF